jgi:formylmethanofuran:tetrahydromethanopterin formyltransferase
MAFRQIVRWCRLAAESEDLLRGREVVVVARMMGECKVESGRGFRNG